MTPLRIGVLGAAGFRGKDFLRLFSQPESNVEVSVVADTNLEALTNFYEGQSIRRPRFCTNLAELLTTRVDAVVVSTPDWLHEEHACAALKAGKHVYLEKPMAITPDGCDNIMRVAQESGRVLYVGHNLRHFTVIKKLKEIIDSGAVGEVRAVWCRHPVSYGRRAYFGEGMWHKKRRNSGGLLIHKGAHDLDVIHWLAGGRTVRLTAMGTLAVWGKEPGEPDIEDLSSVQMQLDNGVQATYAQCHFAFRASREYMIHGTEGTLQNDGDRASDAVVRLFTSRDKKDSGTPTKEWRFDAERGFHGDADKRIVDEFIGIIRGKQQPTISVEDAAWAVKTGWAATQSLRNGSSPVYVR